VADLALTGQCVAFGCCLLAARWPRADRVLTKDCCRSAAAIKLSMIKGGGHGAACSGDGGNLTRGGGTRRLHRAASIRAHQQPAERFLPVAGVVPASM